MSLILRLTCRRERFEQVTREVHRLPMEEFVTQEELQRCTLHELRVHPPGLCAELCWISPALKIVTTMSIVDEYGRTVAVP